VNETYEAALKGLVDATLLPIEVQKGWNLADVSRSITLLPFGYCTSNVGVMNLKKWNSLPKDIQEIILKVAEDMPDKAGKAWWYSDLEALDYFTSKGGKVITLTAEDAKGWLEAVKPIIDDYVARANAAGFPGAEYVKYIQDRGKYWTEHHTAKKDETLAWAQKELLPLK
jgi:TRAP-type C4-dicarboxylate transport system substrate-binding protein